MFVLPSPSKFRGTTDNFVHWSINAIARINILFFLKNSGLLSTNVVALFNYTNKVISNEICLVYLYFNYGYIYNHVFLNNGGTYWYKQPDIWNLLDIYILIRANPGLDRNEQQQVSQRVTIKQKDIGLRNTRSLYNHSSSSHLAVMINNKISPNT